MCDMCRIIHIKCLMCDFERENKKKSSPIENWLINSQSSAAKNTSDN